jgi:uncharacterized membrane protein
MPKIIKMKNIIVPILFIAGIICICAFLIPAYTINYYGDPVPEQTNIFTQHDIYYHKIFLYILVWSLISVALHFIIKKLPS